MNFIDGIYRAIEDSNEEREGRKAHYPSMLPILVDGVNEGNCRRAIFYRMTNVKRTNRPAGVNLLKMEIGNLAHDMLNRYLQKGYPDFEYAIETPVKWQQEGLKYEMSGRMDVGVKLPTHIEGIDWKATSGRGVTMKQKNGPDPAHLAQVFVYLEQPVAPMDVYNLYYFARDSGFTYGFEFTRSDVDKLRMVWLNSGIESDFALSMDQIIEPLQQVEWAIDNEAPPDRDFHKKDKFPCSYCDWKDHCWG